MPRPVTWFAGFALVSCLTLPTLVRAQADDAEGELLTNAKEVIESPKFDGMTIITHPSPEELEKGFAGWAKKYPQSFKFETRGKTPQGRPILMGRITDAGVPDTDKQVAMFTSCHGAKELNATTGLLRLMKYLLSDDPEAAEIRKRQIVLVVPYTDPDHIALGQLKQTRLIYNGKIAGGGQLWTIDGVTSPEKYPEAAALQGIMDEYRPELYIDYHGLNYAGQAMWDSTGVSWGCPVSRSFLHDIPRMIDDATEAQGFLVTRGEQDDGKILTTSPVPGYPDYLFYLRHPTSNSTTYPYAKYHTLSFIMECGSEERIVAATKAALQIGHQRYRYEQYEGYPVNQVGNWTAISVAAYGATASERRASRVELWQKLPKIQYAGASPTPARDVAMGFVSTTDEGRKMLSGKMSDIVEKLKSNPQFDAAGLASVTARYPFKAFGSPRPVYKPTEGEQATGRVEHGLTIRLAVPYGDATIKEVRLDGHLIKESATDGYTLRRDPGVIVEFAIPPKKVADAHIVSCVYDTPTQRRPGFGPQDW
ncbi:MAG: M14 family zinc carboxypeptidase [Tepidisphaeraceae bacterium]